MTSFRLCSRAPRTTIWLSAIAHHPFSDNVTGKYTAPSREAKESDCSFRNFSTERTGFSVSARRHFGRSAKSKLRLRAARMEARSAGPTSGGPRPQRALLFAIPAGWLHNDTGPLHRVANGVVRDPERLFPGAAGGTGRRLPAAGRPLAHGLGPRGGRVAQGLARRERGRGHGEADPGRGLSPGGRRRQLPGRGVALGDKGAAGGLRAGLRPRARPLRARAGRPAAAPAARSSGAATRSCSSPTARAGRCSRARGASPPSRRPPRESRVSSGGPWS